MAEFIFLMLFCTFLAGYALVLGAAHGADGWGRRKASPLTL
ncbi:hypothetical protein RXV86_05580 [Alisedimentitalea sp. MJ-SS2]|nr:hypothetical protein [Alisedimentitalea sp. MJ-SS2]MDU8926846.1 hypothetical protein [Alisedimentitalea sp. MJ-SS2]